VIDRALDWISVIGLDLYRGLVSPYKGYACAHRLKFGGESCSVFAHRNLVAQGWSAGRKAVSSRLRECHAASVAMRRGRHAPAGLAEGRGDHFDDQLDSVPEAEGEKVEDDLDESCKKAAGFCLGGCCGHELFPWLWDGLLTYLFG
jgi:hypothetical protein